MDQRQKVEDLEIDLLLEGVFQQCGFDFRGYERVPFKRKLLQLMRMHDMATVSAFQDQVLRDNTTRDAMLRALCPSPTPLFDNPLHLNALRRVLAPCLKSFPLPLIWIAECNGVEAACTVAILLDEEQLGRKAGVFATAANEWQMQRAPEARIELTRLRNSEDCYHASGGRVRVDDYFHHNAGSAALIPNLWSRIVWAQHNLVTDASFNEFQLIVCRGVLAAYGALLRRRALQLFHDSLSPFGLLSVDGLNDVEIESYFSGYKEISRAHGLYMRIG